jgi:hypothetical protein
MVLAPHPESIIQTKETMLTSKTFGQATLATKYQSHLSILQSSLHVHE